MCTSRTCFGVRDSPFDQAFAVWDFACWLGHASSSLPSGSWYCSIFVCGLACVPGYVLLLLVKRAFWEQPRSDELIKLASQSLRLCCLSWPCAAFRACDALQRANLYMRAYVFLTFFSVSGYACWPLWHLWHSGKTHQRRRPSLFACSLSWCCCSVYRIPFVTWCLCCGGGLVHRHMWSAIAPWVSSIWPGHEDQLRCGLWQTSVGESFSAWVARAKVQYWGMFRPTVAASNFSETSALWANDYLFDHALALGDDMLPYARSTSLFASVGKNQPS